MITVKMALAGSVCSQYGFSRGSRGIFFAVISTDLPLAIDSAAAAVPAARKAAAPGAKKKASTAKKKGPAVSRRALGLKGSGLS